MLIMGSKNSFGLVLAHGTQSWPPFGLRGSETKGGGIESTDGARQSVNDKFLLIFPNFLDLLSTRLMFEWSGALI